MLHSSRNKRRYFKHFLMSVSPRLKCGPYLGDASGIQVLPRNFRNSFLFAATCNNSPSFRCVSAAKRVCKDVSIFRKTITYFFKKVFCSNLWQFHSVSTDPFFFFPGFRLLPFCFFCVAFFISHLFCFDCLVIFFVYLCCFLVLCLCAGFKIGICAFKPARQ